MTPCLDTDLCNVWGGKSTRKIIARILFYLNNLRGYGSHFRIDDFLSLHFTCKVAFSSGLVLIKLFFIKSSDGFLFKIS